MRVLRILILLCALLFFCGLRSQAQLLTHVDAVTDGTSWSYTLFNDEAAGSAEYVTSFGLTVNAPVSVTGTPAGWDYTSDNATYVHWYNADPAIPYPHDIAPGTSLAGFAVYSPGAFSASLVYGMAAWDHALDAPGYAASGRVLSPSVVPSAVPEPGTWGLLAAGLVAMGLRRKEKGRFGR